MSQIGSMSIARLSIDRARSSYWVGVFATIRITDSELIAPRKNTLTLALSVQSVGGVGKVRKPKIILKF